MIGRLPMIISSYITINYTRLSVKGNTFQFLVSSTLWLATLCNYISGLAKDFLIRCQMAVPDIYRYLQKQRRHGIRSLFFDSTKKIIETGIKNQDQIRELATYKSTHLNIRQNPSSILLQKPRTKTSKIAKFSSFCLKALRDIFTYNYNEGVNYTTVNHQSDLLATDYEATQAEPVCCSISSLINATDEGDHEIQMLEKETQELQRETEEEKRKQDDISQRQRKRKEDRLREARKGVAVIVHSFNESVAEETKKLNDWVERPD